LVPRMLERDLGHGRGVRNEKNFGSKKSRGKSPRSRAHAKKNARKEWVVGKLFDSVVWCSGGGGSFRTALSESGGGVTGGLISGLRHARRNLI